MSDGHSRSVSAAAAERLNAAGPQIDREWRQWTGRYFRAARVGGLMVEMPYDPLPDDKEVNLPRYVVAWRYAEDCLRRRAARSCT